MSGHHSDHMDDHDKGLSHDLPRLAGRGAGFGRRTVLGLAGGIGVAALTGCATESSGLTGASADAGGPGAPPGGGGTAGSGATVAEGEIPEETAGPFPGDGSNGPDVLAESGVVRSDITASFGDASGVAQGVPLTVRLKVQDLAGDEAAALAGAAVYLWHCDRDGNYSMYSEATVDENYLRGVQATGADGAVEFTSIYPGCYAGRWPHLHFEVYDSLDGATNATNKLRTSQLAFPRDVCEQVYGAGEGYDASLENLSRVSLDTDNVFSDGYSLQMAKLSGSVSEGYVATLNVPV